MAVTRAKYINCQPSGARLQYVAAYGPGTPREELREIMYTFGPLPGVLNAAVGVAQIHGDRLEVVMVEVALRIS